MIRSLFSYYGGKHAISDSYDYPLHNTIIEPFAGSAGYAHRHHTHDVILIEKNPIVAELWRWLIAANRSDVLAIPLLENGQDVRSMGLPTAVETLVGFWCNPGTASPRRTLAAWARARPESPAYWSQACRRVTANNIHKIDHWMVIEGDYTDAPDIDATWFIDPPYSAPAGIQYRYNEIDYPRLGEWCSSRSGQTIVCEMDGADWMSFSHHCSTNGQERKSNEVVWMNQRRQQSLFSDDQNISLSMSTG